MYNVRSTIYDLRSTPYDLQLYSLSTYCNLHLNDLPSKLYKLLFALYSLRSTMYNVRSTIYDLRSTLYDLRSTAVLSKHLLQPSFKRSTLKALPATLCTLRSTLYELRSTLYNLLSTIYTLLSKHLLQPLFTQSPVALWSEHLDRSWRVVGSNPIWDSHFSEFVSLCISD